MATSIERLTAAVAHAVGEADAVKSELAVATGAAASTDAKLDELSGQLETAFPAPAPAPVLAEPAAQ